MRNKIFGFLSETNEGINLKVKLVPNSSHNKIQDYCDDYIRIKISSPAVENKANKELVIYLSKILDVNKSKIIIESGEKSKLKKILIKDSNINDISQKIMFMVD